MLLAIFIISIALGTISKLQFWVIQFGSSADCSIYVLHRLYSIDRAVPYEPVCENHFCASPVNDGMVLTFLEFRKNIRKFKIETTAASAFAL